MTIVTDVLRAMPSSSPPSRRIDPGAVEVMDEAETVQSDMTIVTDVLRAVPSSSPPSRRIDPEAIEVIGEAETVQSERKAKGSVDTKAVALLVSEAVLAVVPPLLVSSKSSRTGHASSADVDLEMAEG